MTIEERLENLEQELGRVKRRNRWLLGAIVLVAGGFIIPAVLETTAFRAQAQAGGAAEEIQAKRIVVVDNKGNKRIELSLIDNDPALKLYDEHGKTRGFLTSDEDSSSLMLGDGKGQLSAILTAGKDRRNLSFYNEKGETIARLGNTGIGSVLTLHNENGRVRAWLSSEEGVPGLALNDENGMARAFLTASKDGPALVLFDEKAMTRFVAGKAETESPEGKTIKYPESSLILFGPDGKIIWSAIK